MKLKPDCDIVSFLKAVSLCRNEVYFVSEQNDFLNLKSLLSAYIFLATAEGHSWLEKGSIYLQDDTDRQNIEMFIK